MKKETKKGDGKACRGFIPYPEAEEERKKKKSRPVYRKGRSLFNKK